MQKAGWKVVAKNNTPRNHQLSAWKGHITGHGDQDEA
jgi:hypothetical protein